MKFNILPSATLSFSSPSIVDDRLNLFASPPIVSAATVFDDGNDDVGSIFHCCFPQKLREAIMSYLTNDTNDDVVLSDASELNEMAATSHRMLFVSFDV